MPKHNQTFSMRRGHIALATLTATLMMSASHQAFADENCDYIPSTSPPVGVTGGKPDAINRICRGKAVLTQDVTRSGAGNTNSAAINNTGTGAPLDYAGIGANWHVAVALLGQNTSLAIMDTAKITANLDVNSVADRSAHTVVGVAAIQHGVSVSVENWGDVLAQHAGTGAVYGIAAQQSGDGRNNPEEMTIVNHGTITAERTATSITINTNTVSGTGSGSTNVTVPAPTSGNANATFSGNLGNAAAVFQNEGTERFFVYNKKDATIEGKGPLTAGVYTFGTSSYIENDGTIKAPLAIGSYVEAKPENEDGVDKITVGRTNIVNNKTGTITGDIVSTDANAVRWFSSYSIAGKYYDGLKLAPNDSGVGRHDTYIENAGTIGADNITLGSGSHTIVNTGTIRGAAEGTATSINVDMRRNFNYEQTGLGAWDRYVYADGMPQEGDDDDDDGEVYKKLTKADTIAAFLNARPDHYFKLDNAGTLTGDVNVRTGDRTNWTNPNGSDSGNAGYNSPYKVDIVTHITGSGVGHTTEDNASLNSGYIGGTLSIGTGTFNTTTGKFDFNASTINTGGNNGAIVTVAPKLDAIVHDGEYFLVANKLYGDTLPTINEDANSFFVNWSIAKNTADQLVVGADVKDASDVEGLSKPGVSTLKALLGYTGTDDDLQALGAAVLSLSDEDDVKKAGKQLSPETNFATQQAAITLNNAIGQHIDTRLNSVGATGASQGYTSAPYGLGMKPQQTDPNRSNLGGSLKDDPEFIAPRSAALWGQAFGAGMNQNERQDVDGYDARIYGLMVGYDNWISPGMRVGVAGGYANTRIDDEGDTTHNHTDIDSYLIQAYGAVKGSGWYATGRTGFTWHDYDTQRAMTEPFEDVAKGSHNGDQFNASVEIGAPMAHSGTIITPVASLTYSRLHQDGYSEASDGGMALAVGSQNNDSFVSGLGVKALVPIASDTVIEGRALWLHEFADDAQVVNASFAAGGGTFTAAGPGVGRDSADLGIGMLAQIGFNSTFEINYDANVREDYLAHVGSARIDVHF
ncbi:MAG: autotransporter domain-containing protein [Hyphomicrobium sp.]|uniref:autotransporter family protein n=1 Tax=Hyphomicrobium sp. TaxID=82 RepID=UPI00356978AA